MVLYFMKESCSPCTMMEKWAFTDERVIKALSDFTPVIISGDFEAQMVRRYNVKMFPTLVFTRGWGSEIDRRAGYRDADYLLQWIRKVRENHMTIAALEEQLRDNPTNLELLLAQARNRADAGQIGKALELAGKAAELSPDDADVFALYGLCYLRDEF